ncbi:MAG: PDZ domain-containing protein [Planctomycetaceae bacterium]|nr:PDZ domain-containing protein [Planctomycetaceae bacterium]
MSQAEFDSYLSLLAKFLRLRSRQRAELADELRDHLDSRLDELLAQGKSREQAIKIALEEFGDAAVLAEDFSRLASRRKRRFVMRCTAASAAVVAAVVLLSVALAPPGPNGPGPQQVVAQLKPEATEADEEAADAAEEAADAAATARTSDEHSVEQRAVAELDRKLGKVIPEVKFVETPLRDVLTVVGDAIDADVLIAEQALEEDGIPRDHPVTLSIRRTQVSARTLLDFVLQPLGLTFVNRAGVIYVTTGAEADELLTTKVYNVRDLLENATSHSSTPMGGIGGGGFGGGGKGGIGGGIGGGGFFSIYDAVASGVLSQGIGQIGGGEGGMGGFGGGGLAPQATGAAADLIDAIQHATSGEWMDRDGQGGTLSLFNGLLVVRQTDEVHTQVQKLLEALREAGAAQPGGSVTVPKEGGATGAAEGGGESSYLGPEVSESPLGLKTVSVDELDWFHPRRGQDVSQPGEAGNVAHVIEVIPGSKAEKAGLNAGDIIMSVNVDGGGSKPVTSIADALSRKANSFTLTVWRVDNTNPKELIISIDGGDADATEAPADGERTSATEASSAWQVLGLKLKVLSDAEAKRALTGKKYRGALKIADVRPDGPAARVGVRQNDLLVGLGQWEIGSDEHLNLVLERVIKERSLKAYLVRGDETLIATLPIATK